MLRKTPKYERIAFVASPAPEARKALKRLVKLYGNVTPSRADVVVALGGDGLMLRTLRQAMKAGRPIYGMHRGTVGFLMNEFREKGLKERLTAAQTTVIHPLVMRARDIKGKLHEHYAINEVSLFRQTYQVARLAISDAVLPATAERLPPVAAPPPSSPGAAAPLVLGPVPASHPYRAATTSVVRLFSAFSAGPDGQSWQMGVQGSDVVGRFDWVAAGAVGDAAGPRGGTVAAAWLGWPSRSARSRSRAHSDSSRVRSSTRTVTAGLSRPAGRRRRRGEGRASRASRGPRAWRLSPRGRPSTARSWGAALASTGGGSGAGPNMRFG